MNIEITFPKFIKMGNSSFIRVSYDTWTGYATYWRPCGEWGFQLKSKHYAYYKKLSFEKNWIPVEILPCSPQEFLHDNSYCKSEKTASYFKEAWNEIPDDIKIEQRIYFEDGDWCHEEKYKNINYTFTAFE